MRGAAGSVVEGLRGRGILATKAGDNVLRLLPPLVVKRSDIQGLLVALDAVLATGVGRTIEGGGGAVA
jgi:acetylornithine/succinyldiaminopimelate/putrescine aminotransferase